MGKIKLSADGIWAAEYGGYRCGGAVVGLVLDLGWGASGEVVTVNGTTELYDTRLYNSDGIRAIDDILKNAGSVVYCRPSGGEYASCVFGHARYAGAAGDRIVIACRGYESGGFEVITYVDGAAADSQIVSDGVPADNDYVIFDDSCELFITAGVPMTGGADVVMTDEEHAAALSAVIRCDIDMLICAENEEARISSFIDLISDRIAGGGVIYGITSAEVSIADKETARAVTSVDCGKDTGDAIYYLAGLLASLPFYSSAVGQKYNGSFTINAYDEAAAAEASKNRLVLVNRDEDIYVYRDCNCSGGRFADNSAQRLHCEIKQRIGNIFVERFAGRVKADSTGTSLLRDEIMRVLRELHDGYGIIDVTDSDVNIVVGDDGIISVSADVKYKPNVHSISIGAVTR